MDLDLMADGVAVVGACSSYSSCFFLQHGYPSL